MRDFGSVVEPLVLPMLYPRHDLRLRCAVAFEFVRDQHSRRVPQSLEQLAKEAFGRLPVTPAQDIGIGLPELQGPLPDGFVGDEDAPAGHQLLDVPKT